MDGPVTGYIMDYSNYHRGCGSCGTILSQVRGTIPAPCPICYRAHYCSPRCFITEFRTRHYDECRRDADKEVDPSGANVLSATQALWDLRRYTARWHDELGDAAIAALDLHSSPSNIDQQALVVYLSYIPGTLRVMQRFRIHRSEAHPLSTLVGPSMDEAKRKREKNTSLNRESGMTGCALIVLACNVPRVGLVFNSTFIGPEPSILEYPPPEDWEVRLRAAVSKAESAAP